jgi:branched-chain amino acid transport system ATP-binding protein
MVEARLCTVALQKRFGGVLATDHVSLAINQGEVHALIGPNGAGKTTLLAQLTGQLRPDAGTVHFAGHDITALSASARARLGLARSFQITSVLQDFTVLDNVAMAVQAHQGHSFRFWKAARRDAALRDPAMAVLCDVGLGTRAEVLAAQLSHGEQRQLEIAMALASDPRMLLLDEPMAGMGTDEAARLVAYLKSLKGRRTMLLVEHDMDAVFALADRISVLVYGRIIATDTPAAIRANADVRQACLGDEATHA